MVLGHHSWLLSFPVTSPYLSLGDGAGLFRLCRVTFPLLRLLLSPLCATPPGASLFPGVHPLKAGSCFRLGFNLKVTSDFCFFITSLRTKDRLGANFRLSLWSPLQPLGRFSWSWRKSVCCTAVCWVVVIGAVFFLQPAPPILLPDSLFFVQMLVEFVVTALCPSLV